MVGLKYTCHNILVLSALQSLVQAKLIKSCLIFCFPASHVPQFHTHQKLMYDLHS